MTDLQEQVSIAQRANLDFFFGMAGKMLEGEEKLIKLNLDTAKTTFGEWYQRVQDGLSDREDHTGLPDSLALPSADKVLAYERQVAEITSTTQTQLSEIINGRYQEISRQVQWIAENVAQNVPVTLMKSAITLANTAQESVNKATKTVVEVAQSDLDTTTKSTSETTDVADRAVEKSVRIAKQ